MSAFHKNPVYRVGGGAAAQSEFPELWMPPETAHAEDDEFNAEDGILTGWSRTFTKSGTAIDPTAAFGAGNPRDDLKNSWLRVQPPADNTPISIYKSFAGGGALPDGTYLARMGFDYRFAAESSRHLMTLRLTDGEPSAAAYSPPPYAGATLLRDPNANLEFRGERNTGSYTDWATSDLQGEGFRSSMVYIAIVRKAPDHWVFIGNGVKWGYMGPTGSSIQPGGTLKYVVFGFVSSTTTAPGNPVYRIDFFRYLPDTVLP